jgi:hypothetical protein
MQCIPRLPSRHVIVTIERLLILMKLMTGGGWQTAYEKLQTFVSYIGNPGDQVPSLVSRSGNAIARCGSDLSGASLSTLGR